MSKHQLNYVKHARTSKKTDGQKRCNEIREQIKIGKANCDEKFRIINEIYDTVDNCIRQLDSDFSRFESQLKGGLCDLDEEESNIKVKPSKPSKLTSKNRFDSKSVKSKKISRTDKLMARKLSSVVKSKSLQKSKTIKRNSQSLLLKKLFKSNAHAGIPASASLVLTLTNNPNEVLDMPMDPYEPIYCDCHDVSYGDMIGCDNPDCPIEWFHFACVGIIDKPKGLWYCPRCRVSLSK